MINTKGIVLNKYLIPNDTNQITSYENRHYLKETLANNVDSDETPHYAASHQGLHCFQYKRA